MKNLLIPMVVFLMISFSLGEKIVSNPHELSVEVITSNNQQTIIEYNFGSFHQFQVEIDGETYYRLYLPKEAVTFEKGSPELPKITRSIIISDDAKVDGNAHIKITSNDQTRTAMYRVFMCGLLPTTSMLATLYFFYVDSTDGNIQRV